jgi:hypothetical protein
MAFSASDLHIFAAAGLLALVHLFGGQLRFLQAQPRSIWLSLGGGISVAYVFIHLLPELQQHQQTLRQAFSSALASLHHHAYLIALLGLTVFYGLERLALRDRRQRQNAGEETTSPAVFWISMGSFTVYNGLIGYLLVEQVRVGAGNLYLFTGAMGLHFIVNDYGLREHHQARHRHIGRWLLSAAVLLGAVLGMYREVPAVLVSALIVFLAGGVILNVLKEELPAERESSFGAFAVGTAGYAALLLTFSASVLQN